MNIEWPRCIIKSQESAPVRKIRDWKRSHINEVHLARVLLAKRQQNKEQ